MSWLAVGFRAGGNVSPARFVKINGEYTVTQCGAGEMPVGISQEYVRYAPGTAWDDTYAATSGQYLLVYQPGALCAIDAGHTVTAGDFLKSDANGRGITAGAGDKYGAQALESSSGSGDRIRVRVAQGELET